MGIILGSCHVGFILLSFCAAAPFFTLAQNTTVYKCVIKGVPTFSQTPCAKDAQVITLKDINVIALNKGENKLYFSHHRCVAYSVWL